MPAKRRKGSELTSWAEAELLVPLDGRDESVRAVPMARDLFAPPRRGLRLVSVVSHRGDVERRERWLAEIGARYLDGVEHSIQAIASDHIVDALVDAAAPDRLVCMSTAGSVRFHSGHFGSVAEGVARRLGRPMLMVGPSVDPADGKRRRRVVAPVDGSAHADAATVPAAELAAALGVPLWLVLVESPLAIATEAESLSGGAPGDDDEYLEALAQRLGESVAVEVHHELLRSENPDQAIVAFAGDDAIAVMSTHGRSGLGRLFAGSVTAGVVARSPRAVVVICPEV